MWLSIEEDRKINRNDLLSKITGGWCYTKCFETYVNHIQCSKSLKKAQMLAIINELL